MLGALAAAGRWDEAPLLRDLARHRFALIVIATDVTRPELTGVYWSSAVLAALQRHYRLLYRVSRSGLHLCPPMSGDR